MDLWRDFHGPNAAYILDLYERYREDPGSVDGITRQIFEHWTPEEMGPVLPEGQPALLAEGWERFLEKAVAVANLAQSIRAYGYLEARLDPLGSPPSGDPTLNPASYGLTDEELVRLPASLVGGMLVEGSSRPPANAQEAVKELRRIYCSTKGYDTAHVTAPEERQWLREVAESGCFCPPNIPSNPTRLLERLTQVDAFEKFLQRTFPGKTRFSIEGVDMLVPVLDEITGTAAEDEVCVIFIGMAHRGRLNVLTNVHQKPFSQILAEFKDPGRNATMRQEMGYTGDVKYHKGALRAVEGSSNPDDQGLDGGGAVQGAAQDAAQEAAQDAAQEAAQEAIRIILCMPPNPSHLEHINPVVEGMARAADTGTDRPGKPAFYPKASLPILIHGDAAFTGQGVVAETLNLSRLPGFNTAGTIHIITNNQLGFTASAEESRSTRHASDLAKGFKIPIIHVNADDPEACIEAARIAYAYRARFQKDFLIDLIGYRRYGHNEGDEPTFTQPVMYQKIREHPAVRELWARALEERGVIEPGTAEQWMQARLDEYQKVYETLEPEKDLVETLPASPPPGAARKVHTGVAVENLRELNRALMQLPEGFHLNPKLERSFQRRKEIFEAKDSQEPAAIDWATAEELAFASILQDGVPIRLTGQDAVRGTFSQRHASFTDVETGELFLPLQNLPVAKAAFEIHNSPLSESAVLAFEHGYTMVASDRLVIWEAQYGDFVNVGQAIIDEFITSGRAKWGHLPSLVMLLPHGNEGQGPDHSSARLERFLQLAAEDNLRIAYPTTAAQYFHLLRRQAALLKTDPLPLIVLTPKSLLRHPRAASKPSDLDGGQWTPVIDDEAVLSGEIKASGVRRLILCSGRVYVDLLASDLREKRAGLAIARVEQLAPYPGQEIKKTLDRYPALEEVTWVQEEPANMGAWEHIRPRLSESIAGRCLLNVVSRPPSSSPAEGSAAGYAVNQRLLVEQALAEGGQAGSPAQDEGPVKAKKRQAKKASQPVRVAETD